MKQSKKCQECPYFKRADEECKTEKIYSKYAEQLHKNEGFLMSNFKIDDTGMSRRTLKQLHKHGIDTIYDVFITLKNNTLSYMLGFKAYNEVISMLSLIQMVEFSCLNYFIGEDM